MGGVRRRTGPVARQLGVTLTAWRRAGVLDGPEHAVTRASLRAAAEAVDVAVAAVRDGEGSAYVVTTTTRALFDMVTAVRPIVAAGGDDEWSRFLSELGAPAVRDDA
jgi:hypothetical protein